MKPNCRISWIIYKINSEKAANKTKNVTSLLFYDQMKSYLWHKGKIFATFAIQHKLSMENYPTEAKKSKSTEKTKFTTILISLE